MTESDYEKQLGWLRDIAVTKQVSRMRIELCVEVQKMRTFEKYKAILLPYIRELLEKGCKVIVSYGHRGVYPNQWEKIIYDLTKLPSADQLQELLDLEFVSYPQTLIG